MDNMSIRKFFQQKKIHKKWWFWVIVIIIIGGIGSSGDKDKKTTDNSKPTTTQESKDVKKEEPKKEEPKKEEFDFSKADLTKENIDKAISGVIEKDKLKGIDVKVEKEKNIIDITYDPGTVWDEKALVKTTAVNATKVMEVLFKNPKVDKVWFWTQTDMTDAKGNTSKENVVNVALTKEKAEGINWANFKNMVQGDYTKLFNIADGKFIHPAIAKKLN